jgi:hypothetical protein
MREPAFPPVAQAFLKHFLRAFSGGKSLYASVREALCQRTNQKFRFHSNLAFFAGTGCPKAPLNLPANELVQLRQVYQRLGHPHSFLGANILATGQSWNSAGTGKPVKGAIFPSQPISQQSPVRNFTVSAVFYCTAT